MMAGKVAKSGVGKNMAESWKSRQFIPVLIIPSNLPKFSIHK